jgi:prepilin-type N-terminal cleavage/methylation domain-containing protein
MKSRKQKQPYPQSSQAGFTIIESLLAIIIVTILMVALGPVIVMSVAARVQAKRVERASNATRTYLDAVRSGTIPATKIEVGTAFTATAGTTPFLKNLAPPTSADFPKDQIGQSQRIQVFTALILIALLGAARVVLLT